MHNFLKGIIYLGVGFGALVVGVVVLMGFLTDTNFFDYCHSIRSCF